MDGVGKIYKARLVANGFTQEKGVDYYEMYALVAKYVTIWLVCVLVALFGLELDQIDVVSAFFCGNLEETIFMRQPHGFVKKGQEELVCKFNKVIVWTEASSKTMEQVVPQIHI